MIAEFPGRLVMTGSSSVAAELQAALAGFVADNRLPAAAAAVVRGNEVAWSGATGFADARRAARDAWDAVPGSPPSPRRSPAAAVMRLRDAGRLALDEPAVAYLPELRRAVSPFGPIESVTIRPDALP